MNCRDNKTLSFLKLFFPAPGLLEDKARHKLGEGESKIEVEFLDRR